MIDKKQLKTEVTGRRGKDVRSYWITLRKFQEKTLDGTLWRTTFGRSYGPVLRQATC